MSRPGCERQAFTALTALLISAMPVQGLEPINIGILKADSLVIPVFRYSQGKWEQFQDGTGQDSARSADWIRGPWHSYLAEPCYGPVLTNDPVPVAFQTGEAVPFFDGGYGLRVISAIPSSAVSGPCTDTIVTNPIPIPVAPLEDLRGDSFRWDRLLGLVLPEIERIEDEDVKTRPDGSPSFRKLWPKTIAERRQHAAVFLDLWKTYDGRFVFYVLERTYPKPYGQPDSACYLTTVAEGWLTGDGETEPSKPLEPRVMFSDCDWKAIERLRPLGTLDLDGRDFFIGRAHGYESRQEVVVELGATPRIVARGHWQGPGD